MKKLENTLTIDNLDFSTAKIVAKKYRNGETSYILCTPETADEIIRENKAIVDTCNISELDCKDYFN